MRVTSISGLDCRLFPLFIAKLAQIKSREGSNQILPRCLLYFTGYSGVFFARFHFVLYDSNHSNIV
jgi:hypothetical protein